MIVLPMRRDSAPPAVRAAIPRALAAGDDDVAEALAKVSTPEDQALAKQQQAFDHMAALQAEGLREANAIRDMAMEQLKRDEEVLKKWIEMI